MEVELNFVTQSKESLPMICSNYSQPSSNKMEYMNTVPTISKTIPIMRNFLYIQRTQRFLKSLDVPMLHLVWMVANSFR